jgi:hypothetical protein
MFPPLRDRPRDPALMRMQIEVPSSFANALKAYRNHRITFSGHPFEVIRAISLYAGQISFNAGTHKMKYFSGIT